MQDQVGAGPLIDRLQKSIKNTLSRVVPAGPLALVDYPDHANVGDSAIWLGEVAYLERELGLRPSYSCSLADYSAATLKECLPSGAILIHGGGNFGTLWRKHQDFRIHLMERFPDRPIIQLPQSIHFSDDESVAETARAIHKHGRFTLLVRDRKSYDFAAAKLDCPVHLCPDMVFYIGRTERVPPKVDLLYLLRTDHEQVGTLRPPDTEETRIVSDWLTESRHRLRLTNFGSLARSVLAGRRAAARAGETYNALAWGRYRRGAKILSQGKLVITDRLHAHIMSILLDIPHVALDNSYGKLGSFIAAWTGDFSGLRQAATMEAAIVRARELAQMARNNTSCRRVS